MQSASQKLEHTVPPVLAGAWLQYLLCLSYVPLVALDWAGLVGAFAGLVVMLGLFLFAILEVVFIVRRWRRQRWRGIVPLAALVLTLFVGHYAGRFAGDRLIRHRFEANRAAYDAVADELLRGTYPNRLHAEHTHLAYWARVLEEPENGTSKRVVGASFLVVSHGFAGHVGFVRLADAATAGRLLRSPPPGGWSTWLGQLDGTWYLVAN